MASTVSLVVRCFNEESHIGRLLSGVERQTRRPDETVIVDSGSSDATLSIASAFGAKIVAIAPDDFSFGRALNLGLKEATGDLAVFASAHVYPVYDTWLEHLLRPLDDAGCALSYGRQVTPAGGTFSEGQLLDRWFPRRSISRQRDPFCNNANAAIRRAIWEDTPYDEELTGLEDLDWGRRVLGLGWYLSYAADAPVVHVHQESFRQITNRYRREAIAHKQIYSEQELRLTSAVRLGAANIADDLRAAQRKRCLRRHARGVLRFRSAQFLGTYQGFKQQGPVPEMLRRRFYYPSSGESLDDVDQTIGRVLHYEQLPDGAAADAD